MIAWLIGLIFWKLAITFLIGCYLITAWVIGLPRHSGDQGALSAHAVALFSFAALILAALLMGGDR